MNKNSCQSCIYAIPTIESISKKDVYWPDDWQCAIDNAGYPDGNCEDHQSDTWND